jgi:hypothetical protein
VASLPQCDETEDNILPMLLEHHEDPPEIGALTNIIRIILDNKIETQPRLDNLEGNNSRNMANKILILPRDGFSRRRAEKTKNTTC